MLMTKVKLKPLAKFLMESLSTQAAAYLKSRGARSFLQERLPALPRPVERPAPVTQSCHSHYLSSGTALKLKYYDRLWRNAQVYLTSLNPIAAERRRLDRFRIIDRIHGVHRRGGEHFSCNVSYY